MGVASVQVLGRGVDTGRFSPNHRCAALRAEWGALDNSPVALVVGRLAPEKNLQLAMRAFVALRQSRPDTVCVVVGDGPLAAKLKSAHPWVRFCGTRTGADLARHYASADVLLFPSLTETFGNVLLEGLASGLATVSFDDAAAATHVMHGQTGYKATKGDETMFLRLAIQAIRHQPADALRQAARQAALGCNWESIAREFAARLAAPMAAIDPQISPTPKHQRISRPAGPDGIDHAHA